MLSEDIRRQMGEVACRAAAAVAYEGAGTCEFLLAENHTDFYFLEMNTRLQVEHPITEMVTGVDLVKAQLRVASGEPLWFTQDDVEMRGHAVECRVYAEDPYANFRPSPGPLVGYREPTGPFVRVDSGVAEGGEVPIHYDPMIAKLVVWGQDRADAIARARRALHEYRIVGIPTSIPFFTALFDDEDFKQGRYDTGFLTPERMGALMGTPSTEDDTPFIAAAIARFEADAGKDDAKPTASTSGWKRAFRWAQHHRRPA